MDETPRLAGRPNSLSVPYQGTAFFPAEAVRVPSSSIAPPTTLRMAETMRLVLEAQDKAAKAAVDLFVPR
jgi:hypothetical protein